MKKELNFELLKSLYKVFSPSMNEKKMRRFIKRHINNNISGVTIVQDVAGNLLITKGESDSYPCREIRGGNFQTSHQVCLIMPRLKSQKIA